MGFPLGTGFGSDTESDDILAMLLRMQGTAYPSDPDSKRYGELAAWAEVHELTVETVHAVLNNIFAALATELLPEWEQAMRAKWPSTLTPEERQRRLLVLRSITGRASQIDIERVTSAIASGACTVQRTTATAIATEGSEPDGVLQAGLIVPATFDARVGAEDVLRRMLPAAMYGQRWRARPASMIALDGPARWNAGDQMLGHVVLTQAGTYAQPRPPSRFRDYSFGSRLDAADINALEAGALIGAADSSSSILLQTPGNERRVFFAIHLTVGATATLIALDARNRLARVSILVDGTDIRPGGTYDNAANAASGGEALLFTGPGYDGVNPPVYQVDPIVAVSGVNVYADLSAPHHLLISSVNDRYVVGYVELSGDVTTGVKGEPHVATAVDGATLNAAGLTDTWWSIMRGAISAGGGDPVACDVWPGFRSQGDGDAKNGYGGALRVAVLGATKRPASNANTYILDASMDWRDRLLHVDVIIHGGASRASTFPGAPLDGDLGAAASGAPLSVFGFTGTGVTAGNASVQAYHLPIGATARIAARNDGVLIFEQQTGSDQDFSSCILHIHATDQLGKRSSATSLQSPAAAGAKVMPFELNHLQDVGHSSQVVSRGPAPLAAEVLSQAMPLGRVRRDGVPTSWRVGQRNGQLKHAFSAKAPTSELRQPVGPRARRVLAVRSLTHGVNLAVDSSIDWRDRLITIVGAYSSSEDLTPGNGHDADIDLLANQFRLVFYSTGPASPTWNVTTNLWFYVENDGTLHVHNNTGGTTFSIVAWVEGTFALGPRSV